MRICLNVYKVRVARPRMAAHPKPERKELMIRDVVRHLAEERRARLAQRSMHSQSKIDIRPRTGTETEGCADQTGDSK